MNLISADLDILESKELVNSTQLPFPSELPQFIEYLVCISLIAPKMLDADDGTNVSRNNFPRSAIILDLNIESNNPCYIAQRYSTSLSPFFSTIIETYSGEKLFPGQSSSKGK